MRLSLVIVGVILLLGQRLAPAATNESVPIETNFVSGVELSHRDLDAIVKLANLCGIDRVSGVSTERHLSGISILVRGDEKIDGRTVLFKTLLVHREGWPGGARPGGTTKSVGEFWVGSPAQPNEDERTIVRIGNRTLHVGLLNGIKPAGADKVIEAFASGRVRYASEGLKQRTSDTDFAQPSWLGLSTGKCWISFSSRPLRHIVFDLKDNEVIVVDIIDFYE